MLHFNPPWGRKPPITLQEQEDDWVHHLLGTSKNPAAMLTHDIEGEDTAIIDYEDHIWRFEAIGDKETTVLLEHIAEEERHHKAELSRRLEEIAREPGYGAKAMKTQDLFYKRPQRG
ncbi:MAG: ferritin-like domain-containing protein [Chloroflexota bacterium]|nr:ferritin-like domain-containing protein [Chloroflexota bacterium]